MPKIKTREEWLNQAVLLLSPDFKAIGKTVPKQVKVSCGFPSRNPLGTAKRSIGECWSDTASAGKYHEIFISPTIVEREEVLAVLVHEVVHAIVGVEHKHKKPFGDVARAIGLEGKLTATVAGEALASRLGALAKALGPYPHARLEGMTNGKAKEGTRLLKAVCPNPECGYVIRVTKKWIEQAGYPTCPCGEVFTEEGEKE
jgi:hypothetical protein